MRTRDHVEAAKLYATRPNGSDSMPYFAHQIQSFPLVESPKCPTMAMSEKGVMYYGPEYVRQCSVPELGTIVLHENMHFVMNHAARAKVKNVSTNVERRVWNIAVDIEVDAVLLAAGLPFPNVSPALVASMFGLPEGQSAEWYYDELMKNPPEPQKDPCGGAAGNPGDWEDPEAEENLGRSDSDLQQIKQITANALKEAKERGTLAAGLDVWAAVAAGPAEVPWDQLMRFRMSQAITTAKGRADYSFTRPSRRQGSFGWGGRSPVMPGMTAPDIDALMVIDSSASMSAEEELALALREAQGFLDHTGASVKFMSCDAQTYGVQTVSSAAEILANLRGGGGTSFVPIFEELEKMPKKPSLVMIFTDGGGDAPAVAPAGVHVIWVLLGRSKCRPHVTGSWGSEIDWGDFVEVDLA